MGLTLELERGFAYTCAIYFTQSEFTEENICATCRFNTILPILIFNLRSKFPDRIVATNCESRCDRHIRYAFFRFA